MDEFDLIRNPFVNFTNPANFELCEEELAYPFPASVD